MFQQGARPAPPENSESALRVTVGAERLFTTQAKGGKVLPGDFLHPRSIHNVMVIEEDSKGDEWMQVGRFRWVKTREGLDVRAAIDGKFPVIGPDHPKAPWRAALSEEQDLHGGVRALQAHAWDRIPEDVSEVEQAIAEAAIGMIGLASSSAKGSPFSVIVGALSAQDPKINVGIKNWSAPIAALIQAEGLKLPWSSASAWARHPLGAWPASLAQLEELARKQGVWLSVEEAKLTEGECPVGSIVAVKPRGEGAEACASILIGGDEEGDLFCLGSVGDRPVGIIRADLDAVLGVVLPSKR
jgi:hypothetical protein